MPDSCGMQRRRNLDRIEALLAELRRLPRLRERKSGYFSRERGHFSDATPSRVSREAGEGAIWDV